MQELTLTRTKTTVTLTDGQVSWELDRQNVRRLIAQLVEAEGKLEDGAPVESRRVSGFAVARKGAL
jgi:hypothetical protein